MSIEKLFEKVMLNNNVEVPNKSAIVSLRLFSCNPDSSIDGEEREYLKLR